MLSATLDLLYPARCALCNAFDPRVICPTCRTEMPSLAVELVDGPSPVDASAAVHDYQGRAAQAVRRLKYERVLTHAGEMAEELFAVASSLGLDRADATIPVPIHWSRHCERGFNQSLLLAAHFSNVSPDLLVRTRRTRQQVGLTPDQRLTNLKGAFLASADAAGKTLLLLDDVMTSGGTARECATSLKAAGAYRVDLITYCRGGSVYNL